MSAGSKITVPVAKFLIEKFGALGIEILYDHGKKRIVTQDNVGRIVAWRGEKYFQPYRPKQLAHPDIAILPERSNRVNLLVEIEDANEYGSSDRPKLIVGDAIATLLGTGLAFRQNAKIRLLELGNWTTYVVSVQMGSRPHQDLFEARGRFLQEKLQMLKSCLDTPNATVADVIIKTFTNKHDLEQILSEYVNRIFKSS